VNPVDSPAVPASSAKPIIRRRLVLLTAAAVAVAVVAVWLFLAERQLKSAETELRSGRPDLALQLVDEYLADHPGHGRASAIKARALVASGRPQQALELFETVGAASPVDLHAWAQAYLHLGQWSAARPLLEQAAEQTPDDRDVHHELAACYANLGRYREALDAARTFTQKTQNKARGELMIGTLHRDMGNYRQAAKSYARVLKQEPQGRGLQVTPHEFLYSYGVILLELGQPAEAVDRFEASLAAAASPEAFSDCGRALVQLGRADEAETMWKNALALDPNDRVAREGLATAALRRQDSETAFDYLRPLADDPRLKASTAYLMQRAHAVAGHSEEAQSWQQRAAALRADEQLRSTINRVMIDSPNSPWADVLRAFQSAENGHWDEAASLLARVSFRDPFVTDLRRAVRDRGTLPSLKDLPISQF
jgi:tetratricopeptide (TPR) repeat protein